MVTVPRHVPVRNDDGPDGAGWTRRRPAACGERDHQRDRQQASAAFMRLSFHTAHWPGHTGTSRKRSDACS